MSRMSILTYIHNRLAKLIGLQVISVRSHRKVKFSVVRKGPLKNHAAVLF